MGETWVFGVLWLILSVLAELAATVIKKNPLYYIASTQGVIALDAFNFLLTVLIPVFVFVALFLVYTMVRFSLRRGETMKPMRSYATGNKAFVGIWVLGSIIINIVFFLHPTTVDMEEMFAAASPSTNKGDLVVDVVARQWEWIYSYPQYGITQAVNAQGQDELVLPVDRKVKFVLQSYDPFHTYDNAIGVIHSFWIPAFGIKEDVIPGETRYEYITPTKITSYSVNPMVRVQCAEVCGPGHPWMESPVSIVSASDFQKWIQFEKGLQQG